MTRSRPNVLALFAAVLLFVASFPSGGIGNAQAPATVPAAAIGASRTALDRYVEAPDPSYKYEVVATVPGKDQTTTVIEMTSQTWRAPTEVDRTAWKHWLTVVKPTEVRHGKAFLYITGGNNNNAAPKAADENLVRMATTTRSVVAELRMVPNQPLVFAGDGKPRVDLGGHPKPASDGHLKTGHLA